MKKIFFLTLIYFISSGLFSQEEIARYHVKNTVMKISAYKDGENYQWQNKNVTSALDYKIGTYTLKLRNSDFVFNKTEESSINDSTQTEMEYTFQGILPIREIIDQKQISQDYVVELQLINWELSLDNTINFNMNITNPNPGNTKANYRVFQLHGKLYNNELQLPALEGFENEIEIWITFNAYAITR